MDNYQRTYEITKSAEDYLEEKKVHDLFQNFMKQLIIHRPDNPLDFLIDRIDKKEPVRVFIVGPPGSIAKHLTRRLAKELGFTTISVGEIVRKEAAKSTDIGKLIADCMNNYRYVPDSTI
jgi:adenylate kinase